MPGGPCRRPDRRRCRGGRGRPATATLVVRALGARVLPDPGCGMRVVSALDVFMVPFFRSCGSSVACGWPAQPLPVWVVDPQVPSPAVRLSNPKSLTVVWLAAWQSGGAAAGEQADQVDILVEAAEVGGGQHRVEVVAVVGVLVVGGVGGQAGARAGEGEPEVGGAIVDRSEGQSRGTGRCSTRPPRTRCSGRSSSPAEMGMMASVPAARVLATPDLEGVAAVLLDLVATGGLGGGLGGGVGHPDGRLQVGRGADPVMVRHGLTVSPPMVVIRPPDRGPSAGPWSAWPGCRSRGRSRGRPPRPGRRGRR